MQSAADGSQCNINAARRQPAARVLEEKLSDCFAYRATGDFSDVIEKLLPEPFSCPLSLVPMATSNGAVACLLFSRC